MKTNLFTLGIAAAVGSLGFSGSAVAQAQATSLVISPTGMGAVSNLKCNTAG